MTRAHPILRQQPGLRDRDQNRVNARAREALAIWRAGGVLINPRFDLTGYLAWDRARRDAESSLETISGNPISDAIVSGISKAMGHTAPTEAGSPSTDRSGPRSAPLVDRKGGHP